MIQGATAAVDTHKIQFLPAAVALLPSHYSHLAEDRDELLAVGRGPSAHWSRELLKRCTPAQQRQARQKRSRLPILLVSFWSAAAT